jgi:uncharacterized integral membrane protein
MRREHHGGDEPEDPRDVEDRDRLHQLQRARQARVAKVVVGLGILAILVLFIVWNSQRVPVNYVFFKAHNRLIWVMLGCALLGGILGFIVGRPGKAFRFRRDEDRAK